MSLVDLHVHLLAGVDDGPADEAEALEHAARLAADGIREATATPHVGHPRFPLDPRSIPERTRELQAAIDAAGIGVTIRPGGELHPAGVGALSAAELEAVAQGPPGARWLLFEIPFAGIDDDWVASCAEMRARGYSLVIAHPERAANVLGEGMRRLRGPMTAGAVLQVNVCSLLGRHGELAQTAAERFVRSGLAYLLGSDGHGRARAQTLAAGERLAVAAGASKLRARQLTRANPRFLLDQGIPAPVRVDRAWQARNASAIPALVAARRRLR